MEKNNKTQLAETAVDTENATPNTQQPAEAPANEQLFNETATNVLFEMATAKAKALRLSKNACEIIACDMSDCIALADMLDTLLLNDCSYNRPLKENVLSYLYATAHALHDLAEKVHNCLTELALAMHKEDFTKIKELLPYVEY